ncbi:hypothetical protein CBR_g19447 [Chara braunii]|uniref:DUF3730 domain-containing protein n=1 Tax=Chara braunii TaxID=69332 RepID=A0A388KYB3_CHABU|nr:hypothetical protein CBR_g19447 [Chara braunii]|eukprot:GBG74933.1 hypothetical protein CBR_g19447 [Chara braunii]
MGSDKYSMHLDRLDMRHSAAQRMAVRSIFQHLKASSDPDRPEEFESGRAAARACLTHKNPSVVDEAVRNLCDLAQSERLEKLGWGGGGDFCEFCLSELLVALAGGVGDASRLADSSIIRGIGFVVRLQLSRKTWADASQLADSSSAPADPSSRDYHRERKYELPAERAVMSASSHPFWKVLSSRPEGQKELLRQVALVLIKAPSPHHMDAVLYLLPFLLQCFLEQSTQISAKGTFVRGLQELLASLALSSKYPPLSRSIFHLLLLHLPLYDISVTQSRIAALAGAEDVVEILGAMLEHSHQVTKSGAEPAVLTEVERESSYVENRNATTQGRLQQHSQDAQTTFLLKSTTAMVVGLCHELAKQSQPLIPGLLILKRTTQLCLQHSAGAGAGFAVHIPTLCALLLYNEDQDEQVLLLTLIRWWLSSLTQRRAMIPVKSVDPTVVDVRAPPPLPRSDEEATAVSASQELLIGSLLSVFPCLHLMTMPSESVRQAALALLSEAEKVFTDQELVTKLCKHSRRPDKASQSEMETAEIVVPNCGRTLGAVLAELVNTVWLGKVALLSALPAFAGHSVVVGPTLQVLQPLQCHQSKFMKVMGLRLLCRVWQISDKAFPCLQELLVHKTPMGYRSDDPEQGIARAACIRDVCKKSSHRGIELVLAIQGCIEDRSCPSIVALGLDALAHLCHDDAIDFYTAWRVISKTIPSLPWDPIIAPSFCKFMRYGAMDAAAYPYLAQRVLQLLFEAASRREKFNIVEVLHPVKSREYARFLLTETSAAAQEACESLVIKALTFDHRFGPLPLEGATAQDGNFSMPSLSPPIFLAADAFASTPGFGLLSRGIADQSNPRL